MNIILIPKIGIIGAAFSTLFCYMIAAAMPTIELYKKLRISIDTSTISKITVASAVMGLIVSKIELEPVMDMAATCLIGAGVYIIILLGLKTFSKKEIEYAKEFAGGRYKKSLKPPQ